MKKTHRLGKPVSILTIIAIATTGISTPAFAGTEITTPQDSLQLAQASLAGQCRAAKISIPVFRDSSATSEALRLVATDQTVTLAGTASDVNGFIAVSGPVAGFVYAVNLKPCGSNPPPTPTKALCRRVIRPIEGLTIRQDATVSSAIVGGVGYLQQVTVTTNPVTVKREGNRDWVQISTPASGWVSNGIVTESLSNLGYCP